MKHVIVSSMLSLKLRNTPSLYLRLKAKDVDMLIMRLARSQFPNFMFIISILQKKKNMKRRTISFRFMAKENDDVKCHNKKIDKYIRVILPGVYTDECNTFSWCNGKAVAFSVLVFLCCYRKAIYYIYDDDNRNNPFITSLFQLYIQIIYHYRCVVHSNGGWRIFRRSNYLSPLTLYVCCEFNKFETDISRSTNGILHPIHISLHFLICYFCFIPLLSCGDLPLPAVVGTEFSQWTLDLHLISIVYFLLPLRF